MSRGGHKRNRAILVYPSIMMGVFLIVPFGLMLAMSFWRRIPSGTFEPGFVLDSYAAILTGFYVERILFTLAISSLAALFAVILAFPFTYLLTLMSRRAQVRWMIALLSTLSLSEVLIAFAWSVLLSRTAGISNIAVWFGLLDKPTALSPGAFGLFTGLVYLCFPYAVLVLYPALSRLDRTLSEAARSMGASELRAFFTVIFPMSKQALVATWVLGFVFTLGAYVSPQVLGRPKHWTLAVHITDAALSRSNVPMGAALSMILVAICICLVAVAAIIGRSREKAAS